MLDSEAVAVSVLRLIPNHYVIWDVPDPALPYVLGRTHIAAGGKFHNTTEQTPPQMNTSYCTAVRFLRLRLELRTMIYVAHAALVHQNTE